MQSANRGQSSIEYVVSYGWAILVILVIGIVLWQLGVFTPQASTMSFSGFGKLKPQLGGTGLNSTGFFEGLFTNGVGAKIYVNEVTVKDDMGNIICCFPATACLVAATTNDRVGGVNNIQFVASGPPKISAGDVFEVHLEGCLVSGVNSGDQYNIQVEISYDSLSGNSKVPHGDAGGIRGSYE